MEKTNSFLETEGLWHLIRKYAMPCVISLVVAALYNIVDQLFIASAPYLGSSGNAANTVVFPLTVVALALAVMIGDGACAFVSISLGGNDRNRAGRCVGNAVLLSLIAGTVLAVMYFIFDDALLTVFGGRVNANTYSFAKEYFFYITLGLPFYVFGQAMNPIIRSDGSPKFAMASTLAGAAVNVVLDPLFIFGFKWGMMGAAVATVLGQVLTAALSIWYLFHMKAVKVKKCDLSPDRHVISRFLSLGICSFLAQISLVAAMAATNCMILKYSRTDPIFGRPEFSQIPMAVFGIVMKFFQIIVSVSIGTAAGCIPIVGYNSGAGRFDRVKKLLTRLLAIEALVGAAALIVVEFLPKQLIGLFGAANESVHYTNFAVNCFRIYLCMIIAACINKAVFIFLQSLGKALLSTALSMIREVVFGVGLVLILPRYFGLDGVLYSMPAADLLAFIVSAAAIVFTYRSLNRQSDAAYQETPPHDDLPLRQSC